MSLEAARKRTGQYRVIIGQETRSKVSMAIKNPREAPSQGLMYGRTYGRETPSQSFFAAVLQDSQQTYAVRTCEKVALDPTNRPLRSFLDLQARFPKDDPHWFEDVLDYHVTLVPGGDSATNVDRVDGDSGTLSWKGELATPESGGSVSGRTTVSGEAYGIVEGSEEVTVSGELATLVTGRKGRTRGACSVSHFGCGDRERHKI
jgi:hypothetical protein